MDKNYLDFVRTLGIFRFLKIPFNKFTIDVGNLFLGLFSKGVKNSDELEFKRIEIKSFDDKKLELYYFNPLKISTGKIMIYFHGGAFSYKAYKSHYQICKRYSLECGYKVLFVNYRSAYRHQYPYQVFDCLSAYKYVISHNNELGVLLDKIVIAGDSAGGCLCVELLKELDNLKIIKPKLQMLIYPVLDKKMETESMKKYQKTPIWNSINNKKMWKFYVGDNKEYISPSEYDDLSFVCDTYIETAEFDCLRDEAIEFSKKLAAININVHIVNTENTFHGYDMIKNENIEKIIKERLEYLKKHDL